MNCSYLKNSGLLIAGLLLAVTAAAKVDEILPTNTYEILSDVYSDTIPSGTCFVYGKVYEAYSGSPVNKGLVGESSYIRQTRTSPQGEFGLSLKDTDSVFYFHHQDYGEIVIWNYDFKSGHVVHINFITSNQHQAIMPVAEKPVIYLYADTPIHAELSLKPLGQLSFTYPKYEDSWKVEVSKNGLIKSNQRSYPYLFWEANLDKLDFTIENGQLEGFYINTDTTIQFLENVLANLGLNQTEQTDFITYWGPRLTQYNFATVQFLIDEAYDRNIAGINVSPQPDAQRRIYMTFQGSNLGFSPNYLVEPTFPPFKRKGFTLIEWGGSELPVPVSN